SAPRTRVHPQTFDAQSPETRPAAIGFVPPNASASDILKRLLGGPVRRVGSFGGGGGGSCVVSRGDPSWQPPSAVAWLAPHVRTYPRGAIRRPGNRSTLIRSPTGSWTESSASSCTGGFIRSPASLPRGGSRMC